MTLENRPAPQTTPDPRRSGLPTAISADLLRPPRLILGLFVCLLAVTAVGLVAWASQAPIDEVTIGEGRIIPARKLQLVQSLEGGIVRAINVREGQIVQQGDPLVEIDPTGFGASLGGQTEKLAGLEALRARLSAEVNDTPLVFSAALQAQRGDLIANEQRIFESRRAELVAALNALSLVADQRRQEITEAEARIATLSESLALALRENEMIAPMVRSGVAPRIELLRLETRINDTRGQILAAELSLPRINAALAEAQSRRREKEMNFRGDALTRLSAADVEYAVLAQTSQGDTDKVRRADIRAPISGTIKTVSPTTLGEVVKPGANIIEIVPADDTLLVEARVRPQDIAFLRPGLAATVKLSAYDYAIYGGLTATLSRIGADSVLNEQGEAFYMVDVRTTRAHLERNGHHLPIIAGMVATVEIKTGTKTALDYLSKPITRLAHQSLRER